MIETFTIGELEAAAGVPRRTIYFYVQQGILPPPSGAGLAARYHRSHLLRLRAIPVLRAQGWRLDRIRELFQASSDEVICQILDGRTPNRPVGTVKLPPSPLLARSTPMPAPTYLARYTLAPGIDLLVQRDLPAEYARALDRLLEVAMRLFSPGGNVDALEDSQAAEAVERAASLGTAGDHSGACESP